MEKPPANDSPELVISAGTYDGVLAGWEFKKEKLELTFATPVHTGSIRSLSIAANPEIGEPGSLLSCGYDETLRTHDWHKRLTSSGEIRTPSDFGTPICSAFAPPTENSTHCIIGFSNGKICIYKKRDWSVQHVLAGHDGGVGSLSVHPSGKLALSGGVTDGKLKLWDLTKGRLAFVSKIKSASAFGGKPRFDSVDSIVWSNDGIFYALAYGPHITVREMATGKDLLDVDLPSRVNQVTLLSGAEGVFVAAACNDGSLPVLAVEDSDDENRRAIMAIEPVEAHLAREERFKCIKAIHDYYVATANSAGVVSLMDLSGAVKMIMPQETPEENDSDSEDQSGSDSDDDEGEMELAVNILDSVQLGTGARITCLAAWGKVAASYDQEPLEESEVEESAEADPEHIVEPNGLKRKDNGTDVTMNEEAVKRARTLVEKAKDIQKRKKKRKKRSK